MPTPSVEKVRQILASIELGRSDAERGRRTALLGRVPPSSRVAMILEAAADSVELRRAAALAIAKVGGVGKNEALARLMADADPRTRWNAAGAFAMSGKMAQSSVPALAALVERGLPRSRSVGALREALMALGAANTPAALRVLLAVPPGGFAVGAFRADWLEAIARYRSPRARRVLTAFLVSTNANERIPAIVGTLRNGRDSSLADLRAALDSDDFVVARNAARQAHDALGTRMVFHPAQLVALRRWWDRSGADVEARVQRARSGEGRSPGAR